MPISSCSSSCWVLNSVAGRGAAVAVWSASVAVVSAGASRMTVGARLSLRATGA